MGGSAPDFALLGGCQAGSLAQADRARGVPQALLDAGFRLQKRACVADEHYVPTLLAVHGLDNQVNTTLFVRTQCELLFEHFRMGGAGREPVAVVSP